MPSNNVFQYSKIRTRKRSAKKIIKPEKNGIHLFLESGIHCAGIRNPVPGIRNPQHGIQNPRLSWIPLHGAIFRGLVPMLKPFQLQRREFPLQELLVPAVTSAMFVALKSLLFFCSDILNLKLFESQTAKGK